MEFVPVLKYLWGRGVFYSVSGFLQLSELSGIFLVLVGVLFVAFGWSTKKRLLKLKKCLRDPEEIEKVLFLANMTKMEIII